MPPAQLHRGTRVIDDLHGNVRPADLAKRAHPIRAVQQDPFVGGERGHDRRVAELPIAAQALNETQRARPLGVLMEANAIRRHQAKVGNPVRGPHG